MPESRSDTSQSTLRTMFSGHYPPTDLELRELVEGGLVVLDANALLDMYRFTPGTRAEYLEALGLLGDRLWIPHRAAEEFMGRRGDAIASISEERASFERISSKRWRNRSR
ncbi:PIN-like domain-containing protein [Nocardia sp. NPDC059239]|uniref:PIN-like domain-containing protein n=1 Tax=Nocardia sp. NPDC059239 TaxID=3346785 RepID=UPI00369DFCBF